MQILLEKKLTHPQNEFNGNILDRLGNFRRFYQWYSENSRENVENFPVFSI
jgi:hypothetical protein